MKNSIYLLLLFLISCSESSNKPSGKLQPDKKDSIVKNQELIVIADSTTVLEGRGLQLELEFIAWRCKCPNWITTSDRLKYQDSGPLEKHCIYIEPADSNQVLPDSFQWKKYDIKVIGKFITDRQYPKDHNPIKDDAYPGKVFRYTDFKIIAKKNAPY